MEPIKRNATIVLANGQEVMPYRVKCYRPGCARYCSGYLTVHRSPGATFYYKRGTRQVDLREQDYACREHGIADGPSFLYRDEG